MSRIAYPTADLCDAQPDDVEIAEPLFRGYGALTTFGGPITTVKVFEDNVLVRKALEQPGQGRVLVVDGGGSTRCALVGDRLATLARDNGWAGIIVYGCIRDSEPIAEIAIGIKAVGTCPRKSIKRGQGQVDIPVRFAGVRFSPGAWVYADPDGILVSDVAITP